MGSLFSLDKKTIDSMYETWARIYVKGKLKRCMKCILPETIPFISFDKKGICNYCWAYKKVEPRGEKALEKVVADYRNNLKKPDCVVGLSGGRDSSFGLHYVKNILGMHPVAYTYDWGMTTPVAHRNQGRMCNALGVKHIVIRANGRAKRDNIRKNIEAWLMKPNLGIVPLFMAGDKQVIYYARKVRQQAGANLTFHCIGNRFEDAVFKIGFSNVCVESPMIFCHISLLNKVRVANYYLKQFFVNPAYINKSLLDTLCGYFSLFFLRQRSDDIFLFHFIKWNEQDILSTLINDYGWEIPSGTKVTWRIDDGTAAFYNYIYMTVAGFTENDTFRSDQIREGLLDRIKALECVREENKPRYETIEWYARQIGFDANRAVHIINTMPKLYESS